MRGSAIDYLPVSFYIRALNKVFPFRWSFRCHAPGDPTKPYLAVSSVPIAREGAHQQEFIIPPRGTLIVEGVLTIVDGDKTIEYRDIGAKPYVALDQIHMTLKTAISDARKRTARLLGDQFGNSLRDGGEDDEPQDQTYAKDVEPLSPEEAAKVEKAIFPRFNEKKGGKLAQKVPRCAESTCRKELAPGAPIGALCDSCLAKSEAESLET